MVTRSALQNAASIAKNILTTEAIVAEAPEKAGADARRHARHGRHGRDDRNEPFRRRRSATGRRCGRGSQGLLKRRCRPRRHLRRFSGDRRRQESAVHEKRAAWRRRPFRHLADGGGEHRRGSGLLRHASYPDPVLRSGPATWRGSGAGGNSEARGPSRRRSRAPWHEATSSVRSCVQRCSRRTGRRRCGSRSAPRSRAGRRRAARCRAATSRSSRSSLPGTTSRSGQPCSGVERLAVGLRRRAARRRRVEERERDVGGEALLGVGDDEARRSASAATSSASSRQWTPSNGRVEAAPAGDAVDVLRDLAVGQRVRAPPTSARAASRPRPRPRSPRSRGRRSGTEPACSTGHFSVRYWPGGRRAGS